MDIFDLVFDAFMAFNQLAIFLAGLICLAFGALFVADHIYKRMKGRKVKGRVIGMRAKGSMYHAVYEYTAPDGTRYEVDDSTGFGAVTKNNIGKTVTLYLTGDNPHDARKHGMLGLALSAVFLIPAAAFIYAAATSFEFTWMTLVMALLGIGWAGYKIKKSLTITPRELWEKRNEFKLRPKNKASGTKAAKKEDSSKADKKADGRLLTAQEINESIIEHDKKFMRITIPVMGLVAVAMIAGGLYLYRDMSLISANGVRTSGEIVRIDSEYNSSADSSGYTYYGVVAYRTDSGVEIEFRDNVGSSHPSFKTGDQVDVMYNPQEPQDAIVDRGLLNWLPSVGLCLGGGLLLLWLARSFLLILSRRRSI